MNKLKKLCILLAVLVVVCVVTFVISNHEEKKEKIKVSGETLLSLSNDSITAISWKGEGGSYSFRKDGKWIYESDPDFPVSETALGWVLNDFNNFTVAFEIDEPDSLSQYGLSDPVATIKITADGKDYELLAGGYSTMDSQRYISIGDGKVYLATNDPVDTIDVTLDDLVDNDTIPAITEADSIKVSGAKSAVIVRSENADKETVYSIDGKELDSSLVTTLISTLRNLSTVSPVLYHASEEELKDAGLDTPEYVFEIEYPDTEDGKTVTKTVTISAGLDAAGAAEAQKNEEDMSGVTKYFRLNDSGLVYKINETAYTTLSGCGYNDLRSRSIFSGAFEDVTGLKVTLDGTEYVLETAAENGSTVWKYNGQTIDISTVQSKLTALKAGSADDFTDEKPTHKKELGLEIKLKDGAPNISIEIYRKNGSSCIAAVDGQPIATITRSSAVDLIEALYKIVLE